MILYIISMNVYYWNFNKAMCIWLTARPMWLSPMFHTDISHLVCLLIPSAQPQLFILIEYSTFTPVQAYDSRDIF